jgi:hypothetical protein
MKVMPEKAKKRLMQSVGFQFQSRALLLSTGVPRSKLHGLQDEQEAHEQHQRRKDGKIKAAPLILGAWSLDRVRMTRIYFNITRIQSHVGTWDSQTADNVNNLA